MRRVFRFNPQSGRLEELPPRQGGYRPTPPPAPHCITWRTPMTDNGAAANTFTTFPVRTS